MKRCRQGGERSTRALWFIHGCSTLGYRGGVLVIVPIVTFFTVQPRSVPAFVSRNLLFAQIDVRWSIHCSPASDDNRWFVRFARGHIADGAGHCNTFSSLPNSQPSEISSPTRPLPLRGRDVGTTATLVNPAQHENTERYDTILRFKTIEKR